MSFLLLYLSLFLQFNAASAGIQEITRRLWDGNTPLHEWSYAEKERPQTLTDEFGFESKDREEPVENVVTWIFEEGTFKPAAKIADGKKYSILTDYLGTPAQMYDEKGELVWEMDLDIYGKVRNFAGRSLNECPFRWQGQYEDAETGLYYNFHRYYDPDSGNYISQDPIRLAGNNPTFYGYVKDPNSWLDVFGLRCADVKNGVLEIGQKYPPNSKDAKELEDFIKRWNDVIPEGGLTRQSVPKDTRKAASEAADAYKKANPDLFKNGEVAGHTPDVGWGGNVDGPFTPLSSSVNSYIGGATQAIPIGTTYTSVILI